MTKPRQPALSRPVRPAPTAAPPGFQGLLDDLVSTDVVRRERARKNLVGMGRRAIEPLAAALATADDRYRWRILVVLSEIADRGAVPGVLGCLQSNSPAIRIAAAQFLGDIGALEAVEPLMDLLRANPDDESAPWIIQALGRLGDRRAVSLLVETMHRAQSPAVRYTAIEALTAIGDAGVIQEIRPYAADPSHHVQTRALTALEKLAQT